MWPTSSLTSSRGIFEGAVTRKMQQNHNGVTIWVLFHVNYCLKITRNSSFGSKGLYLKCVRKARWWFGAVAWIRLFLRSYFLPFGDWLARLRVWSPFLCSKFPKFSYLDASTIFTRTTVLLQARTSSQAWQAVPELCQGRVICKPRLQLQPSFLAF